MENTLGGASSGKLDAYCHQCGQLLPGSDVWKKQRFIRGILLALALFLPVLIGLRNAFESISAARTTGLGAVAGGWSESAVLLGIVAVIIFAVGGIVFLVRGFSPEKKVRAILSVIGIAWCGFMLGMICLSVLMIIFTRRH